MNDIELRPYHIHTIIRFMHLEMASSLMFINLFKVAKVDLFVVKVNSLGHV